MNFVLAKTPKQMNSYSNPKTIASLHDISFEKLFEAFQKAFSDYDFQLKADELRTMLTRRGFQADLSFGAFVKGELVAFTFNGIGSFKGVRTAYDTGTGTIKEFRGRGMATQIFNYSIPVLKVAGVKQYLLEVLQHNTKAVSVYKKLGFQVTREFNYFSQDANQLKYGNKKIPAGYVIKEIELPEVNDLNGFYDFIPSWQNSFDSVKRMQEDFLISGAYHNSNLIGFCIFDPNSGDITQIAVHREHRRKGIASVLLQRMLEYNRHDAVKCVNAETSCESIIHFLNAFSIPIKGKQFEMIRKL